jgi:DNA-binding HxlR family transcriptional regulator
VLGKTYDSQVCSIARALEAVGERWSLLIIRDALFAGSSRYGDFQRSLGVATNILSDRLDGFVASGIMQRRRYSARPELYEYLPTKKGRDLASALVALSDWGDRWCSRDGAPVLFKHAECGGRVRHALECTRCGRVDNAVELAVQPGPGLPAEQAELIRARTRERDGS